MEANIAALGASEYQHKKLFRESVHFFDGDCHIVTPCKIFYLSFIIERK